MGQLVYIANSAGGGAAGAPAHLLILDPGGVAGGIVYTSFETAVAAANALQGPVRIWVVPGAVINVTSAGPYDMTDIYWESDMLNRATLVFGDGTSPLTGTELHLKDIVFTSTGNVVVTPAWDMDSDVTVELRGRASIAGSRYLFFDNTGGFTLNIYAYDHSNIISANLIRATVAAAVNIYMSDVAELTGAAFSDPDITFSVNYAGLQLVETIFANWDLSATEPVIRRQTPLVITPPQITGDLNNYAARYWLVADVLIADLDAPHSVTGFSDGGVAVPYDNKAFVPVKKIVNRSANAWTLVHNSGLSTVPIMSGSGADIVLGQYEMAILIYEATTAVWMANKV